MYDGVRKHDIFTAERLRTIVDYDPATGSFLWRTRPRQEFSSERAWAVWNARYQGTRAGCVFQGTHIKIAIDNRPYMAHRLAWLYAYGAWPLRDIDHINGDGTDNRLSNLRLCTGSQNQANRGLNKNNSVGFKGVTISKGKYIAQIMVHRKHVHLGAFATAVEAHNAYLAEAKKVFGPFACDGDREQSRHEQAA